MTSVFPDHRRMSAPVTLLAMATVAPPPQHLSSPPTTTPCCAWPSGKRSHQPLLRPQLQEDLLEHLPVQQVLDLPREVQLHLLPCSPQARRHAPRRSRHEALSGNSTLHLLLHDLHEALGLPSSKTSKSPRHPRSQSTGPQYPHSSPIPRAVLAPHAKGWPHRSLASGLPSLRPPGLNGRSRC